MPIEPRCITSQSQCEVGNDKVRFTVEFYQHQLIDNIKTELPVYIQLTQLPSDNAITEEATTEVGVNAESTNAESTNIEGVNTKSNKAKIANISKVSAYLEGRDMFMGKVPVFFDKKDDSTIYLAEGLLASCTEDQMVWRLWITAETAGEEQTFFVDFMSQRL